MVGCKEKYREERQPKICNPDISSVSETTFPRILYDFWGGFILAKTKHLELTINNLLTCTHS